MDTTVSHFILHSSLIEGAGPVTIQQLINLLNQCSVEELYNFQISDFVRFGFSELASQKIVAGLSSKKVLDDELAAIEQGTVSWTALGSHDYPDLLGSIYAPPPILYWYGAPPDSYKNNLAVVGSRKADAYGKSVVDGVVEIAVANNINLISGGAAGIDGWVHEATLARGGRTVVVTGAGLAHPYPQSHEKLFENVASYGGTVLSIFPVKMEALPGNFPSRNRVISGLSQVCLVVQAAQKSGACITAYHALEQGREVLAVPGRVTDLLHAGCHNLIRQGATLISKPSDLLSAFGIQVQEVPEKRGIKSEIKPERAEVKMMAVVPDNLTELQKQVVLACKSPASIDQIMETTTLSFAQVNNTLFELQMLGMISENAGGCWLS
jgi:DNA processing protein